MNNSVQSAISYGLRSLGYSEAMDAQCRVIEAYMPRCYDGCTNRIREKPDISN